MDEDGLGGLFDSDPGFLEELASGGSVGNSSMDSGMNNDLIGSGTIGIQSIVNAQQPQQAYGASISGLAGNAYTSGGGQGGMQYQQNMNSQQQQQQQHQYSSGGYGNMPKLHHMNIDGVDSMSVMVTQAQSMLGNGQAQQQRIMGNQLISQSPQQFNNQQGTNSIMQQGQVSYQGYGMATGNTNAQAGPRLPNPDQQQIGMNQMSAWNQNQNVYQQQPQQQQQSGQPQQMAGAMPGKPYLSHHDYALHGATLSGVPQQQQIAFVDGQQQQQQPVANQSVMYMPRMSSPANATRMTSPGAVTSIASMGQQRMQLQGGQPSQPFTSVNLTQSTYINNNANTVSMSQQPPSSQQYNNAVMHQQQQQQRTVAQASIPNTSSYQQFPYRSPPQAPAIQQQNFPATGMGDEQTMIRYPQTSPTTQIRAPFQTLPQQRTSLPSMSPRPTPQTPSPSITPDLLSPKGSTSTPQGSFGQPGLQPMGASMASSPNPAASPFHQSASMDLGANDISTNQSQFNMMPFNNTNAGMNAISSANSSPMVSSYAVSSHNNVAIAADVNSSATGNTFTNNPGSVSPSYKSAGQPAGLLSPPQNVTAEMQSLNQQIKHLLSQPQTQQTQQQMLDFQEKLRTMKAQQLLQAQRQKQQQHQQQASFQQAPTTQQMLSPNNNMPQVQQQQQLQQQKQLQQQLQLQQQQQLKQQQTQQQQQKASQIPQTVNTVPGKLVLSQLGDGTFQVSQAMPVQAGGAQPSSTGQTIHKIQLVTSTGNQAQGQVNLQANKGTQKIIIIQQPQKSQQMTQLGNQQQQQTVTIPSQVPLSLPQSLPTTITITPSPNVSQTLIPVSTITPAASSSNGTATGTKHILINQSVAGGGVKTQHVVLKTMNINQIQSELPLATATVPQLTQIPTPVLASIDSKQGEANSNQQQEKANKIIAEAIAKAQKAGKTTLPKVLSPPNPNLPETLLDVENEEEPTTTTEGKPKKKKKRSTPRKDRTPKDKSAEGGTEKKKKSSKKEPAEKKPIEEKPVVIRSSKKKKKPPATFLKRKRKGSSDGSDVEIKITPPPSPENEDDGILKRRSGRHAKRKKYLDDVDLNLSDDESTNVDVEGLDSAVVKPVQLFVDNPAEEDAVVVEKILGMRMRKKDIDTEEENEEEEEDEEYYVKYKNFSYLHCEWKTEKELIRDKRIPLKIKRYKLKKLSMNHYFAALDEEELFNPDYVEVERVLDQSETIDPITEETVTHYLVKWRGLAYEDSTWELQQDVDPEKVKLFKKFREFPPEEDREHKARPKASLWEAMTESKPYKGGNGVREYQLEGVNWLSFCWHKRQNCILADEMGLGKTIQSIAFLHEMFDYGMKGPFLVIAPLSTIGNWQREFDTWTDMNVIVYHGSTPSRIMLGEYEMYYKDENGHRIQDFYKFHAMITTYELIISDFDVLRQIDWRCMVIDEAHRLKNMKCKLMEGLRLFDVEHKVLLSGTPLQNNVEELFSLLNFLEPSQFHSSDAFLAEFGNLRTEEQVDKLKAILKPMMLRRLKEDVEKNLAAKEETIIEVELTNMQKKYYRAILERNFAFLSKGAVSNANVPNLMNTMMELRKCCNHPYLITGAEENILADIKEKQALTMFDQEHLVSAMIQASGKFVLLDKLLPKLKQGGHKVLIFSQMIRVLDIIEDYLINKRHLYERIDGRIRGNLRQEAIDRFSKPDSDRFVFLLCTRAGGLGINLTAADTVIIYDSDWNPQNDLQAQARCHRIGQTKMVKVYRLITRNSYEREMFDKASKKLGLDKAVLQSMGGEKLNNPTQTQMTKLEIEDLLKKGAYGALMEDDNAGDAFCEEDIDQILQRRTQIVQIESEGKGSTFAKASFSVTGNRDDIDINDPEFWQKWAKKADLDTEQSGNNELIIEEPRRRKQTARYGNNDNVVDMSDLGSTSDSEDDGTGTVTETSPKTVRPGKRGKGRGRRRLDADEDFESEKHGIIVGDGYGRSELFKVEKNLLVFGWGRWTDILAHSRFKRKMGPEDVEKIARAVLIYSLQFYKGDERIKEFIFDLVSPSNDGQLKNHSGLSAPVPRGRKGKKLKEKGNSFNAAKEIARAGIDIDPEVILRDNGYKRHIQRHSNKVLLRVRLLYYLKQEVIGEAAEKVASGMPVKDIHIPTPVAEGDPPTHWWDEEADKCLLIGVYKHGYEKYNLMRQDPNLIFLGKCGPPDGAALAAEMDDNDNDNDDMDDKADISLMPDDDADESVSSMSDVLKQTADKPVPFTVKDGEGTDSDKSPFPSISDLNTRLRRIITNYQRDYKKQQLKLAQRAKKMEKQEKLEAVFRERESRRRESQQRWSRREESDFYRVVSTFGIEFDRSKGKYIWDRFKSLARLEKKSDDTLTEYFISFYHMCLRVCRKMKEEAYPPTPVYVEAITEERANRCIARIDLLSKIREEILVHPKLEERIQMCKPSSDLPAWWQCTKHDKELLVGCARHGLARTDYYLLGDTSLSFMETVKDLSPRNTPTGLPMFSDDKSRDTIAVKVEDSETKMEVDGDEVKKEDTTGDEKEPKDTAPTTTAASTEPSVKEEPSGDEVKEEVDEKEKMEVKSEGEDTEMVEEKASEVKKEKVDESVKQEPADVKSDDVKDVVSPEVKAESVDSVKEEEKDGESEEETADAESIVEKMETKEEEGPVPVKVEEKDEELEPGEIKREPKPAVTDDSKDVKKEKSSDETERKDAMVDLTDKDGLNSSTLKSDADEEVRRTMEMNEDDESQSDFFTSVIEGVNSHWPKDRVVFHRLEHVCYCVENGEWPFARKMPQQHIPGIDSGTNTPVGSMTPKQDGDRVTPKPPDLAAELLKSKKKVEKDFEVQIAQGDGLKMTFHKKNKPSKPVDAMEAEKVARIHQILSQNLAVSTASSDDSLSEQQSFINSQVSWPSPWRPTPPPYYYMSQTPESSFMNGSAATEHEMLMNRALLEQQGLVFPERRRRGRKRKAEKMAEIAMAEALARRQTARAVATLEPDSPVPVINLEDGSRLSGEDAPKKKNLDQWLDEHPGFLVDSRDDEIEEGEIVPDFPERRRGRRPRVDPALLDVEKLTGEENVSVINRLTGKKMTGAKAPPLRFLAEWLEQNPCWDVDPKWSDLVRAKGSLPKTLLPRVVTPSRRGRGRPRESNPLVHSMFGGVDALTSAASMGAFSGFGNAALMAGLPKMGMGLPFGALPGLNPMMGLPGFGLGGLGASNLLSKDLESLSKQKNSKTSDKEKSRSESKSSSSMSSPHPSFPMMFNPLMYNPLLAAQAQGLGNFTLPTSLPSSFASLAHTGHVNGQPQSDSEEESKLKSRHLSSTSGRERAEDLSVKKKSGGSSRKVIENTTEAHRKKHERSESFSNADDQDMPCDLSMKSKPSKDEGSNDESKSKSKIVSSFKLNKIVDTLKDRVEKKDDIVVKPKEDRKAKDSKRNKVEAILHAIKDKHSVEGNAVKKSLSESIARVSSHVASSEPSKPKESVPKIVQELLAAKHKKDEERLLKKGVAPTESKTKKPVEQETEVVEESIVTEETTTEEDITSQGPSDLSISETGEEEEIVEAEATS